MNPWCDHARAQATVKPESNDDPVRQSAVKIGLEVSAVAELRTGVCQFVARLVSALLAHREHEYMLFSDRPLTERFGSSAGGPRRPGALPRRPMGLDADDAAGRARSRRP